MVDWGNHPLRTFGIGVGVGGILFLSHLLLWVVDQFFVRKCWFTEETAPDEDEKVALANVKDAAKMIAGIAEEGKVIERI